MQRLYPLLLVACLLGCPAAETPTAAKPEASTGDKPAPDAGKAPAATDAGKTPAATDAGKIPGLPAGVNQAIQEKPEPASGKMLLSKEEAEEILGQTVEVKNRGKNGHSYTSKPPIQAAITVDVAEGAPLELLKAQQKKETVPDLGDDAFYSLDSSKAAILHVKNGATWVSISVSCPFKNPEKEVIPVDATKEVARKILPRL